MISFNLTKCLSTYIKAGEKVYFCLKSRQNRAINNKCYSSQKAYSSPWNVLFFGTDEFALSSLKALNHVCREKGLIQRLEVVTAYNGDENAVIKYAKEHQISVHNWPPTINKNDFEIGVVVSFGHMIPSRLINMFPLGMINVHGSLLPRWRGAAPICHALMNGDTCTGVSIMKIVPKKFDVGAVIAQERIEIGAEETYLDLYKKLADLGADLLTKTIKTLPDVLNTAKPQIEREVTYAPKVTEETSFINWETMSAVNIYNLQRALTGIQPLRTHFKDKVIKLLNVKVVPECTKVFLAQEKIPGLVVFDKKNKKLYISCKGSSWVTAETIIIPGLRPKSSSDFGSGFILNQKQKSCIFE